jgi:hypothetical protein
VVSATDPYGHILGFLDRSRYYFFQVAPQLYSRGLVDTCWLTNSKNVEGIGRGLSVMEGQFWK